MGVDSRNHQFTPGLPPGWERRGEDQPARRACQPSAGRPGGESTGSPAASCSARSCPSCSVRSLATVGHADKRRTREITTRDREGVGLGFGRSAAWCASDGWATAPFLPRQAPFHCGDVSCFWEGRHQRDDALVDEDEGPQVARVRETGLPPLAMPLCERSLR